MMGTTSRSLYHHSRVGTSQVPQKRIAAVRAESLSSEQSSIQYSRVNASAQLSADYVASNGHNEAEQAASKLAVPSNARFRRVMLKISGEALKGAQEFGLDPTVVNMVAREIRDVHQSGVELAIVVGGGNYFRGSSCQIEGLEPATADYVGMLATVMNAVCLQGAIEALGIDTRVLSAIEMKQICEPYVRRRAVRHLEKHRVIIFAAGTGNPFFTTDTAAALRAAEIGADIVLKATKVGGIYESDPASNSKARLYAKVSHSTVHKESLRVMDMTAITLCKENNIPVVVYNMFVAGNTVKACLGQEIGTFVTCDDSEVQFSDDLHHCTEMIEGADQEQS